MQESASIVMETAAETKEGILVSWELASEHERSAKSLTIPTPLHGVVRITRRSIA